MRRLGLAGHVPGQSTTFVLRMSRDRACKLCNQGIPEDAAHFVSTCPVLNEERVKLYSEALPTVRSQIPDPRVHQQGFQEVSEAHARLMG